MRAGSAGALAAMRAPGGSPPLPSHLDGHPILPVGGNDLNASHENGNGNGVTLLTGLENILLSSLPHTAMQDSLPAPADADERVHGLSALEAHIHVPADKGHPSH